MPIKINEDIPRNVVGSVTFDAGLGPILARLSKLTKWTLNSNGYLLVTARGFDLIDARRIVYPNVELNVKLYRAHFGSPIGVAAADLDAHFAEPVKDR